MFKAIQITNDGNYSATITELDDSALTAGDVTVAVEFSTINYKDGLAITGASPVVRSFPMVPGIDFAGTVIDSGDERFVIGDKVLLNGFGVGEVHWGGLAQKARVNADWLLKIPDALSTEQAMAIGTAGYTAMLCVQALANNGVTPESGDILVSGAAGGVGSVAVFLLAQRGYRVVASTGRPDDSGYLKELGAADIINRSEFSGEGRPLAKERWAGAVDVAGSNTLANICASMKYGGVVAACGLAQGMDLPTTVMPFILRGVSLIGVDSVYCPMAKRVSAWAMLAKEWDSEKLASLTNKIGLGEAIGKAEEILAGKVRGRLVVDVNS
jgi:acrylyl-CoA reductase (NADPH)